MLFFDVEKDIANLMSRDSPILDGRPHHIEVRGLMLEAINTIGAERCYQRVGTFSTPDNDDALSSCDAFSLDFIFDPDYRVDDSASAEYIDDERYPDEHWALDIV